MSLFPRPGATWAGVEWGGWWERLTAIYDDGAQARLAAGGVRLAEQAVIADETFHGVGGVAGAYARPAQAKGVAIIDFDHDGLVLVQAVMVGGRKAVHVFQRPPGR